MHSGMPSSLYCNGLPIQYLYCKKSELLNNLSIYLSIYHLSLGKNEVGKFLSKAAENAGFQRAGGN